MYSESSNKVASATTKKKGKARSTKGKGRKLRKREDSNKQHKQIALFVVIIRGSTHSPQIPLVLVLVVVFLVFSVGQNPNPTNACASPPIALVVLCLACFFLISNLIFSVYFL
jgi:hypothetical protein